MNWVITDYRPVAILIAEPDLLFRMVTADMLSDAGFQTIEVRTAAEALAVLDGETPVRVLITARGIEGDGIALAHVVYCRWPTVTVFVTSGAGGEVQQQLPPGARLLVKPFVFGTLVDEVGTALAMTHEKPSSASIWPTGLPSQMGMELGSGVGAVAASMSEPDKT